MATNHQLFVCYVEEDNGTNVIAPKRVMADDCDKITDDRDVIMIKFRKWSGSEFFDDEYSGWPCFLVGRHTGKDPGARITRCRDKSGSTPREARDVTYVDTDNPSAKNRVWPDALFQASMGGSGARLIAYDEGESDYASLLATAQALDPDLTPLS